MVYFPSEGDGCSSSVRNTSFTRFLRLRANALKSTLARKSVKCA